MNFRNLITDPHVRLAPGQLAETEALIRWDMEAIMARAEEEANIEEALAALKLEGQP